MTLLTVIRPDSVRFQKDFQKCKSRFWVIRSNSMPRNSGSMTYFPDVRRERAAIPGRGRLFKACTPLKRPQQDLPSIHHGQKTKKTKTDKRKRLTQARLLFTIRLPI